MFEKLLALAVMSNDLTILREHLKLGGPIDALYEGCTALWRATQSHSYELALELVLAGANINAVCEGQSILARAVNSRNTSLVALLTYKGVKLNLVTLDCTALYIAVSNKDGPSAKLLIDAGCDVNIKHRTKNISPLCLAVLLGEIGLVRLLVAAKPDLEAVNVNELRLTALCMAIMSQRLDITNALLDGGASVNFTTHKKKTPLSYARKHLPLVVERLLALGAREAGVHRHEKLNGTLISTPKVGVTYHLFNGGDETRVTLHGDAVEDKSYIDLASGLWIKACRRGTSGFFSFDTMSFIAKDILPSQFDKASLPAVLMIDSKVNPDYLIKVEELELYINKSSRVCEITGELETEIDFLPKNKFIQGHYQPEIPDIPLEVRTYPIVLPKKRPNIAAISAIYQSFIKSNNDLMLQTQFKLTSELCHIRAHFISLVLALYGIETVKVYKVWLTEQWKPYNKGSWGFHCATMIIDDQYDGYIWDPWVGGHKGLISIKKWVSPIDEPMPKMLFITNRGVVSDYENGNHPDSLNFMEIMCKKYIDALQAMISLAIPNNPEPCIYRMRVGENCRFFQLFGLKGKEAADSSLKCTIGTAHALRA